MWFDVKSDEEIPPGMVNNSYGPVTLYEKFKQKRKLTSGQQNKINCQKIAEETWPKYPILDKAHIAKLPAIIKIVGTKFYKDPDTVPDWVKEKDPLQGSKRKGRRSRETVLEQKKICEKLGIKYDFNL